MLLIETFDSTVPTSVNTTPRSVSSAVIGNMYSIVLSHSNGPPTIAAAWPGAGSPPEGVCRGLAPRNTKPRIVL